MNVDREAFPVMLPTILKHIANSHFVSLDLELSGIPTGRLRTAGRQTLADRYKELREAAQKYHILQVGITCVEQDVKNERYYLRPYNFNISPLIYEGLDLERTFSYSTGAVDFLQQHKYQMDAPFKQGVPYMTRAETKLAKERAIAKWDRDAIPDMDIKADDTYALGFMERVRNEIKEWKRTSKPDSGFFNVAGNDMSSTSDSQAAAPLSRFEKRLVHQLVRSEFPDLQTFSRPMFVSVQPRNEEEQKSIKYATLKRVEKAIFHQSGFRYVAEALAGNDIADIDLSSCHDQIMDERPFHHRIEFTKRMKEIIQSLKEQKRTLIGHNCLIDLIYFYQFFYGDLPETVEEFQAAIHETFPLVADTKYMATTGPGGARFRSSQLWQLEESLEGQEMPRFDIPSDHAQFASGEQYHEAGFDSYVTAKVFLRLASKLEAAGKYVGEDDHFEQLAPRDTASEPAPRDFAKPDTPLPGEHTKKPDTSQRGRYRTGETTPGSRFSHRNRFDGLSPAEGNEAVDVSTNGIAENPVSSSNTAKPSEADALAERVGTLSVDAKGSANSPSRLIAAFDTDFWRVYGNKLRVYGTREEMWDLTEKADAQTGNEETPQQPSRSTFWETVTRAMRLFS